MNDYCQTCGMQNKKVTHPMCGSDIPNIQCPWNLPSRFSSLEVNETIAQPERDERGLTISDENVPCLKQHPELYTGSLCGKCFKTSDDCPEKVAPTAQGEQTGKGDKKQVPESEYDRLFKMKQGMDAKKNQRLIDYIYDFAWHWGRLYHIGDADKIKAAIKEKFQLPEEFLSSPQPPVATQAVDVKDKIECLIGYLETWQQGKSLPLELSEVITEAKEWLSSHHKEEGEAVEFAEWISNNQFTQYNGIWTSTKIHYSPDPYTTPELHQLFITRKTNL